LESSCLALSPSLLNIYYKYTTNSSRVWAKEFLDLAKKLIERTIQARSHNPCPNEKARNDSGQLTGNFSRLSVNWAEVVRDNPFHNTLRQNESSPYPYTPSSG